MTAVRWDACETANDGDWHAMFAQVEFRIEGAAVHQMVRFQPDKERMTTVLRMITVLRKDVGISWEEALRW